MVGREQVQVLPSPAEYAEGSRRRWQLIEADTLAKIQEEFDAELTLEQTATVCGVSTGAVRALVKARLLPALRGPAHGGASEWAFDKQAIHQTLSRLSRATPRDQQVNPAPLGTTGQTEAAHTRTRKTLLVRSRGGEVRRQIAVWVVALSESAGDHNPDIGAISLT